MPKHIKQSVKPRKSPSQQRAQQTVDAILEATARILVEQGWDKTNTNMIARRAGVSIGSLYQYFPNKESLVVALNRRHAQNVHSMIKKEMVHCADTPLKVAVAALVHVIVTAHLDNPELERMLEIELNYFDTQLNKGEDKTILECTQHFFEKYREEIIQPDLTIAISIVMNIAEALVHCLFFQYAGDKSRESREKSICNAIMGYLTYIA